MTALRDQEATYTLGEAVEMTPDQLRARYVVLSDQMTEATQRESYALATARRQSLVIDRIEAEMSEVRKAMLTGRTTVRKVITW